MIARRRLLLLAPLGVAAVGGAAFWTILGRMSTGAFNPRSVPSPLIGKPVPDFALPAQAPDAAGFGAADVRAAGRPMLVNFFASWCVPCVIEHPELMELSRAGVPIWGIAYKDTVAAASGFVARHGNPYARIARDAPGQVAIDWGVYGVPESYLIDPQGIVRWRMAGPLTPDIVSEQLQPLLRAMA